LSFSLSVPREGMLPQSEPAGCTAPEGCRDH
jgi:hypothetical protein